MMDAGCASGAFLEADYVERTAHTSLGGGVYAETIRVRREPTDEEWRAYADALTALGIL